MGGNESYDELTIKLMAMTDEELDRYGKAAINYAKSLDPDSPKLDSTRELLKKIREESERRTADYAQEAPTKYTPPKAEPKKKKSHGCLTAVLVVVLIMLAFSVVASIIGSDDKKEDTTPAMEQQAEDIVQNAVETPAAPVEPETISVNMDLGSGNYIVGIDIPAGRYNITAVSGSGNVSSDNMYSGGINAMMGTEEANADYDLYEQEYKNISLPNGVRLSISGGVVVNLQCDSASGEPLEARNQTITDTVELSNGNYIAGQDFPAGTYTISVVSGGGNVHSDNMYSGGLNAIIGTADLNSDGWNMYEQEYKNIELPDGVTLYIDGVDLLLTPSK